MDGHLKWYPTQNHHPLEKPSWIPISQKIQKSNYEGKQSLKQTRLFLADCILCEIDISLSCSRTCPETFAHSGLVMIALERRDWTIKCCPFENQLSA